MPSAPPNKPASRLGAKIRLLRRQEGLNQVQLAEALGISPSYLNLIEGNKRPLTAPLLIRLAQRFHLDLTALAPEEDQRLSDDLMEVFGDPLFEALGLQAQDVRELVQNSPQLARGVFELYRAYQHTQDSLGTLSSKLSELFGAGYVRDDIYGLAIPLLMQGKVRIDIGDRSERLELADQTQTLPRSNAVQAFEDFLLVYRPEKAPGPAPIRPD